MSLPLPDVDEELVEKIVDNLKSQGIFDQFRKDCLADVDSRPACHNLKDKVNGAVADFLSKQPWRDDLNKNHVRESLRTHVQQHYLEVGVNKIVEQVVNPKIFTVFMPRVEDLVYTIMGMDKPINEEDQSSNRLRYFMSNNTPVLCPGNACPDALPNDLDPVSPGSINESGNESANLNDSVVSRVGDEVDNLSRDVNKESNLDINEASNESKLSGMSDLSSHGSTTKLDISESAHLPGDKSEMHCDVSNIHNLSNAVDGERSRGLNEIAAGGYDFDNFSNLKEKLLITDPLNKNMDKDKIDPSSSFINSNTPELKEAVQSNDLKEFRDDSMSICGNTEDSRIGKMPKSPTSGMYSEDSVGSNCSMRSKMKLEKIHLLNESTRNSIAMECDDSSASFVNKKFEGPKEIESASCIESLKEESQMSLASNDSRKFSDFANLKLTSDNSQMRSAGSSPDISKNISDEKKNDDNYRKSSSHSQQSRERYDSKNRTSSKDRKYSKDSKSKNDRNSNKYSSSNRDKYSSRSRDDKHRSDKKPSEDSKRDQKHSSSYDDKSRRDKDSKHRDDHRSSRNKGKDSQNSSEDDRVKKADVKSSNDKEKDSKSISEKSSKDSKYGNKKDDSKKGSDDQKYSKLKDSESKHSLESKSSKEKTPRTTEDRYSRKDKDSKRSSEDYRRSKNRDKDDSKNASSVDKEHKNSSFRNKESKPSSEDDKGSRKGKEKSPEPGENVDDEKISKSRSDSDSRTSRTDKKSSSDRKGESTDKKKNESASKKDDKDNKKRKRENCSEDTEKKESRRSRDRDDGGHKSSGSSSIDHKESTDKKRKSSSGKQEKSNSSKENSAKEQVDSNESNNSNEIDMILMRIHSSIQDETSLPSEPQQSDIIKVASDQNNFKIPLEVNMIERHKNIDIDEPIVDEVQIVCNYPGDNLNCDQSKNDKMQENDEPVDSVAAEIQITDKSVNIINVETKPILNQELYDINKKSYLDTSISCHSQRTEDFNYENKNNALVKRVSINQSITDYNKVEFTDKNENNDLVENMNTEKSLNHVDAKKPKSDQIKMSDMFDHSSLESYQPKFIEEHKSNQLQVIDQLEHKNVSNDISQSVISNPSMAFEININISDTLNAYSNFEKCNSVQDYLKSTEVSDFNKVLHEKNSSLKPLHADEKNIDNLVKLKQDVNCCNLSSCEDTMADFYGFDQSHMDNSFVCAMKFENFLKTTYGPALNDYLSDKCFSLTDNNINNIGMNKELGFLNEEANASKINLLPSLSEHDSTIILSPVTTSKVCDFLKKNLLVEPTDASCSEINIDLIAPSVPKINVKEKTSGLVDISKETSQVKMNEDVISLCESSSSDRGFTLPSVTEDMLDNFMMENIVDKMDGGYNSSDSDVEGWNVPETPDAIHLTDIEKEEPMSDDNNCVKNDSPSKKIKLSELNRRSKEGKQSPGRSREGAKKVFTDRAKEEKRSPQSKKFLSVRSKHYRSPPLPTKEEKTSPRMSQRYADGDLYKPRPLITNPSRRNRVGSKNSSKPNRGTKRPADSIEFSENKRPR